MDYKTTLNLPQTRFSMRANSATREPELQKFWQDTDVYRQNLEQRTGSKFILHDGPPYLSSGRIHIGHALNRILKDTIVKYQTLNNRPSPVIFGYDCHGLPIEHEVLKKGKKEHLQDALSIRHACEAFALESLEGQQTNFYRLGLLGNWQTPYLTMKPAYEAAQLRVFAEMVDKGYIYKGLKPVYWCISCRTALAEAEVEYADHTSHSVYVRFRLQAEDQAKLPAEVQDKPVSFAIWTTTPWTLPANLGVALNADFDYDFIDTGEEYLIVAEKLREAVTQATGIQGNTVLQLKGQALDLMKAQHPFYDRDSLVVMGSHVTSEAGTGCVHTAPGHGMEDFQVGMKYKLGVLSPVDAQGLFTSDAPGFEGQFYEKANPQIVELLKEKGALLTHSQFSHSYPHCWRSKNPVIYRATKQWFASVDGFREAALKAVDTVEWIPESGKERISNMIADRTDWCISRQRVWGVPIPAFYCQDTGDAILRKDLILHMADLVEKDGSNVWWTKSAEELLPAGFTYEHSQSQVFTKETDIMDVWFDSGTSHHAVLNHYPDVQWPADLYLEGSDQHRGWFQSSLLTSVAAYGQAPYRQVVTHGFVMDSQGRKMSKSLGNTVEPQKVIQEYGADVLRLWVASVDYSTDVRVSYDSLKQLAEIYKKIRNTLRFMISNLYDFDPSQHALPYEQLSELDRFTLHKLQDVVGQVRKSFEQYAFYRVYQLVQNFCVIDLSNIYFAIVKDILYIEHPNSQLRRSVQTVMWEVLRSLMVMVTPILTHLAEDARDSLPEALQQQLPSSILLADFPQMQEQALNADLNGMWQHILQVRDTLNVALENARTQKLIGRSMEATAQIYHEDASVRAYLNQHLELFRQVFILSELEIVDQPSGWAIQESSIQHEAAPTQVAVSVASGEKCERCWVISSAVGQHATHSTLCDRCVAIVESL